MTENNQIAATDKQPAATMTHRSFLYKEERRCIYGSDDDGPCPHSAVGASNFCEHHTHWLQADLEVYKAVGEHFRQDLREFWTRSNFYLLVQAGLLSVFVSISNRTSRSELTMSIALILLGEVLAIIWFLVARASLIWIQRWRGEIIAIDEVVDRHRSYSRMERSAKHGWLSSPSSITHLLPLAFCLAWGVLLGVVIFS
jgi:hypothetical protein